MPWWGVSVHVFCLQYVRCYTDLFAVGGVLQLVTLLPRGVCAKIYECWTFIYGVVLVTVTTTLGLGRCVRWNFFIFYFLFFIFIYFYFFSEMWGFVGFVLWLHLFVLVGRWLWIVIGVGHNFSFL